MLIMEVNEYIQRMKDLGWSDQHINKLVSIYSQFFKADDGRIKVLTGDFDKKNLRRYEKTNI